MPNINLPLNDRQQQWLAGQLDNEIEYLSQLDDLTPDETQLLQEIQALERQLEATITRHGNFQQ